MRRCGVGLQLVEVCSTSWQSVRCERGEAMEGKAGTTLTDGFPAIATAFQSSPMVLYV